MRKLIGLTFVLFLTLAAGQALADASTKVCVAHNNSSGSIEYTVQTSKNAEKHCTQHGDKVVESECCTSSTDISEVNVSFCTEDFDSGCPED